MTEKVHVSIGRTMALNTLSQFFLANLDLVAAGGRNGSVRRAKQRVEACISFRPPTQSLGCIIVAIRTIHRLHVKDVLLDGGPTHCLESIGDVKQAPSLNLSSGRYQYYLSHPPISGILSTNRANESAKAQVGLRS